jgi:hypothetical protein
VTVGLAITFDPVEELNVATGDHVYVVAPVAVSVAEFPAQTVAVFTDKDGTELTVTVVVTTVEQLPTVPVIV